MKVLRLSPWVMPVVIDVVTSAPCGSYASLRCISHSRKAVSNETEENYSELLSPVARDNKLRDECKMKRASEKNKTNVLIEKRSRV